MEAIVESNLAEIKNLLTKYGVVKASLFGSAATGKFSTDSDIDFLITFDPKLTFSEYGDNYFELMYALQDLLNKEVDLVTEKTIQNPYLKQNIEAQKVVLL